MIKNFFTIDNGLAFGHVLQKKMVVCLCPAHLQCCVRDRRFLRRRHWIQGVNFNSILCVYLSYKSI